MDKSEKVEAYYAKEHHFKEGIALLRHLAHKTQAEETYKWSAPVYTVNGKNVFWISRFKNHFGIGFFYGVFLKDRGGVLENAQEGKTQAMRHWKFKSMDEIDEKQVVDYMREALENQKMGLQQLPKKKTSVAFVVPGRLQDALKENPKLKAAFSELSAYKKKEYSEYIVQAKRETTKQSRLAKILPMILEGKGLNDKYK